MNPIIQLSHISYGYESVLTLCDISLTIHQGECIIFTGPNGCGKSTLFKLLNGLVFPSKGQYVFDGQAITQASLQDMPFAKRFHKRIGYVFQNPDVQLFNPTVYDEIAFGPRQMGFTDKQVQSRVRDLLEYVNLTSLADRPPYHLSGGEQKKVAIAAVLALNPDVIMMDEPFNGLDRMSRQWAVSFLKEFSASGKTILIATHEQEVLSHHMGRRIVLTEEHTISL